MATLPVRVHPSDPARHDDAAHDGGDHADENGDDMVQGPSPRAGRGCSACDVAPQPGSLGALNHERTGGALREIVLEGCPGESMMW